MKLQIYLTEEMATDLLTLAQHERRYPRQHAEMLLERAIYSAKRKYAARRSVDASQKEETAEAAYATSTQT